jgi:hypothetical protein
MAEGFAVKPKRVLRQPFQIAAAKIARDVEMPTLGGTL